MTSSRTKQVGVSVSPPRFASGGSLKRGYLAQALIDVLAIGFCVFFASVAGIGIAWGALIIGLEVCRALNGSG